MNIELLRKTIKEDPKMYLAIIPETFTMFVIRVERTLDTISKGHITYLFTDNSDGEYFRYVYNTNQTLWISNSYLTKRV